MRVQTTELGEVNVKFHHIRNEDTHHTTASGRVKADEQTYTECIISVLVPDSGILLQFLGRSYLNPVDTYNKETGRWNSLQRAVEALQTPQKKLPVMGSTDTVTWPKGASKRTGREIFAAYFQR